MICRFCRDGYHSGCDDTVRLGAELLGRIPGMPAGTSRWCDCQHEVPTLAAVLERARRAR